MCLYAAIHPSERQIRGRSDGWEGRFYESVRVKPLGIELEPGGRVKRSWHQYSICQCLPWNQMQQLNTAGDDKPANNNTNSVQRHQREISHWSRCLNIQATAYIKGHKTYAFMWLHGEFSIQVTLFISQLYIINTVQQQKKKLCELQREGNSVKVIW